MVDKLTKSYYFQHDYNASSDAKILFLRQQLGMEGYGIFWFILEQLAQSGGKLPMKIIPVLAMQSQTQESKVRAVIEGYELFQIIDGEFFSIRLNQHLEIRKHLSEHGKIGATARWSKKQDSLPNGHPNSHPIGHPNAKESKESKERKVKKESKPIPDMDVFLDYCKSIDGFAYNSYEFSLKAKYKQWVDNGWKDGHGNKISNWKTKVLNTIPFLKPTATMDEKPKRLYRHDFDTDEEYEKYYQTLK